jgi:uncharacterized protein involved in exopolysaccharide biosynthesis
MARMRFWVWIFVLLVALGLNGCGRAKIYSATAEIELLDRSLITIPVNTNSAGQQIYTGSQLQYESEILLSPEFLQPIVADLKLDRVWARRFNASSDALSMEEALKHMKQMLSVDQDPEFPVHNGSDSSIKIRITAKSEVPQEAADIANAVEDRYKAMRDEDERKLNESDLIALRDRIEQQEKMVSDAKAAAAKDPQDSAKKTKSEIAQTLLETLRIRLKQDLVDIQVSDSPVRIVSRAVAPPE